MENYTPTKTFTEIRKEVQENFKKKYGGLLTEEECVKLVDEIRGELQKEKEKK